MSWTRATASDHAPASAAWRQPWALSLAAGALALLLVGAATFTRAWHALEFRTFDGLTALAARQAPPGPQGGSSPPIVILAIDEPTLQQLQQAWPFPRSLHARLLQRLRAEGALAVGMDMVFAEPSTESEDAALARAIADAKAAGLPVVLASAREQIDSGSATLWTDVQPLQRLLDAGAQAGDAGVEPDDDFVVRRTPAAEAEGFALRLAQQVAAAQGAQAQPQPQLRAAEWIGYRGPRGTVDTRSYYQALEPGLLPVGFFRGKVVLVGRALRTAAELSRTQADLFNSPFGATASDRLFPGVELQATLLDNLLTGSGLRSAPEAWSLALVAFLAPLLLWAGRRLHPAVAAALTAALVLAMAGLSWWLFVRWRLWWPPLWPAASAGAVWGAAALVGYAAVRQRARQTRAMFAQYVPPAVVSRLVEEPALLRLGGEAREVTLLFTDLANFTTLSEQLSAEQTVELLTGYFNAMTPIVHATGGTVDKFIGDAVMAFWGAPLDDPSHAEHAVRAAIAMQQAMEPLVADLRSRGLPPIHMRIGVHTGRVVVGNVGSAQRFAYTAIGDAVNLAARLEGANKAFGTGILLSAATAAQLPPTLALRALEDVIVKGRAEPVRVFTPCADPAVCAASLAALQAVALCDWDRALQCLDDVLHRLPHDPAAQRLRERVTAARALPEGAAWSSAVALDKL